MNTRIKKKRYTRIPAHVDEAVLGGVRPDTVSAGNLMLWLSTYDMSQADNSNVTSWTDLSGNGAHGSSTGFTAPLFRTNQTPNGKPAISFTGQGSTGQALSPSTASTFSIPANSGLTSFLVMKYLWHGAVFDCGSSHQFTVQGNITVYAPYSGCVVSNFYTNPDKARFFLLSAVRPNGSKLDVYINGVSYGTSASNGSTTAATDYWLGRNYDGNNYSTVYLAEVLFYKTAFSTAQRQAIEYYLRKKYDLY